MDAAVYRAGSAGDFNGSQDHGSIVFRTSGSARLCDCCEAWRLTASELIAGPGRVGVKHLHGFQRIVLKIFPNSLELGQDAVRDRNDVAAGVVRLEDVEQFSGTGP